MKPAVSAAIQNAKGVKLMFSKIGFYEVYRQGSEWRWRFRGANHKIIASGESYRRKIDCFKAIELIKNSFSCPIIKYEWSDGLGWLVAPKV